MHEGGFSAAAFAGDDDGAAIANVRAQLCGHLGRQHGPLHEFVQCEPLWKASDGHQGPVPCEWGKNRRATRVEFLEAHGEVRPMRRQVAARSASDCADGVFRAQRSARNFAWWRGS